MLDVLRCAEEEREKFALKVERSYNGDIGCGQRQAVLEERAVCAAGFLRGHGAFERCATR